MSVPSGSYHKNLCVQQHMCQRHTSATGGAMLEFSALVRKRLSGVRKTSHAGFTCTARLELPSPTLT